MDVAVLIFRTELYVCNITNQPFVNSYCMLLWYHRMDKSYDLEILSNTLVYNVIKFNLLINNAINRILNQVCLLQLKRSSFLTYMYITGLLLLYTTPSDY